jgi:hypothetical protein
MALQLTLVEFFFFSLIEFTFCLFSTLVCRSNCDAKAQKTRATRENNDEELESEGILFLVLA